MYYKFQDIFGNFRGFGIFVVILEVLGVFCSSYRISGILVILDILRGILVVYRFRAILVVLEVSWYFW